jgi:hypothetical protein
MNGDDTFLLKKIEKSPTTIEKEINENSDDSSNISDKALDRYIDIVDIRSKLMFEILAKSIKEELDNLKFSTKDLTLLIHSVKVGEGFVDYGEDVEKIVSDISRLKENDVRISHIHQFFGTKNKTHFFHKDKVLRIQSFFDVNGYYEDNWDIEFEIMEILKYLYIEGLDREKLLDDLLEKKVVIESSMLIRPMEIDIHKEPYTQIGNDSEIDLRINLLKTLKEKFYELVKEEERHILKY